MNDQWLLWIVYAALVMSTAIYAIVSWIVLHAHTAKGTIEQELHKPIVMAMAVAAIIALFAAFAFVRIEGEGTARRGRYITRWALIESVCIYAMIAAFVTLDWRLFLAGWVVALAGYALSFPALEGR